MSQAELFVAVPVYRGEEVVAETLRSIRDQTFGNYRVVVSVDGNDAGSAEACRPFTSDPRVRVVVQPERLGWVGNLNWLIERCDCPFFCYWQQDDLTATNYLEALRAEMLAHPDAAIAYADVQWFGARFEREGCAGVFGSPAQRVLQVLEAVHYAPLRGLIRAEFLPRGRALALTEDEGSHSEFPFLAALAARGTLRRVTSTLYFKRAHGRNAHGPWTAWPPYRRRRCWADMGVGIHRVARGVLSEPGDERRLAAAVLDRLAIARAGRGMFYQPDESPAEVARFARDFFSRGGLAVPPAGEPDDGAAAFHRPVHPHVEAALEAEEGAAGARLALGERLRREGGLDLEVKAGGAGLALLGHGWSRDEAWGVWSDGDGGSLLLPAAVHGPWRVTLHGRHYGGEGIAPGQEVRVRWRAEADGPLRTATFRAGEEVSLDLDLGHLGPAHGPVPLPLEFPDSVFLPSAGINDPRKVGFGLSRVRIARR